MLKAIAATWPGRTTRAADPRLAQLQAGDTAVIEAVLLELLPRVRGWLYRRLGPDAALDDVAQEALTEIARALPAYQGQSSLPIYAYRITARVAARHASRRASQRETLSTWPAEQWAQTPQLGDPERAAIERQALRAVVACLSRLPARRREAFVLCELEGMSAQQAAKLTGSTPSAIRSRLMHARRELERRLAGNAAVSAYRGKR